MNRAQILDQAKEYITKDRASTHGKAEDNFSNIAGGWDWWLSIRQDGPLTAYDVSVMMTLFKVARAAGNPSHLDNNVDGVGYFAIAGELGSKMAAISHPVEA